MSEPTTSTEPVSTPPRRARHLMDPHAPRPQRDHAAEQKNLTRVQRWVMSVLAVTTVLHMSGALVLFAVTLDDPQPGARVGLCVLAGAFGVIAVALARVIHGRSAVTPWLLLGTLPTLLGLWAVQLWA